MSGNAGIEARAAALKAIHDVEVDGAWSTLAVPDRVGELAEARDRAFASNLAYETIRWRDTLDWALSFASKRPVEQIERDLLAVLRLGAVQLLRMRVPDRAVVDTAATLARRAVPSSRGKGAAGFVNGVLRGLSRRIAGEGLPWPTDPTTAEELGLVTAHPAWLVADVQARFGTDARAVLDADNRPPGLTLRANGDPTELLTELQQQGIDATIDPGVPMAVRAPGADPRRLAAVEEGRAVPQDVASMQVALALAAQPGDRVLDACAGPGGKTTHLAGMVGPTGSVTALELHEHRARLVAQAADRQHIENVTVVTADAEAWCRDGEEQFDRVLVDAPCTGLGIGRRRPEIRWRRTADDAASLADLQARLLVAAAQRVRPGGRLTYAVCTWTVAETEGVLADPRVAETLNERFRPIDTRQLRPDIDDADGMFMASWVRAPGH